MLEAAGFDRAVHPAFLRRTGFPPPPAGAGVLAFANGARARSASNRLVALVVEGVIGNVVGADVIPDLVFGPIRQRRELHDSAVVVVNFDLPDIGTRRPLIAPKPRYPCAVIHERATER